jgi:tetratricopeptide (TPR) repeat protein
MAEQIFKEGREFAPDDYQFPLNLARIEIDRGHPEKAAPLLEQTLEIGQDTPKAYMFVIDCWVVADHLDRAREVLERARRELTLTVDFYLDLATTLLSRSAPPLPPYGVPMTGIPEPEEGPVLDMVRESVQHAVELKPDDPHVRFQLASTLLSLQPALALEQAQEGVRLLPDEPAGMLLLGVLQGLNDQKREAKATLRRTATMARKKGDYDMAEQADMMREQVGSPFFKLSLTMGHMFDDDIDDYYL